MIGLLLLFAPYILVLFFAHISFVVNRTLRAMGSERLQYNDEQELSKRLQYFVCILFIGCDFHYNN